MKKILFFATIALATIVSNAATMKWGSGAMKNGAGATATAATVSATLYVLDSTAYTTLQTAVAGMSASDASQYIYNAYNGKSGGISATAFSKGAATITDPTSYSAGDTAYAVLVFTSKDGDNNSVGIGNYASFTFEADVDKTLGNMGTKFMGTGATMEWASPVPEPTSALLLVLGVAGLALRRRRA